MTYLPTSPPHSQYGSSHSSGASHRTRSAATGASAAPAPDLERAQRRVRLGHQDGRLRVAAQVPGLDVLLFDPDIETAVSPLVVDPVQSLVGLVTAVQTWNFG